LEILKRAGKALSCHEIAGQTERPEAIHSPVRYSGRAITHNNVNKILKAVPDLAERLEKPGKVLRYRITGSGRAYVRLMDEGYGAV
jgi:hypothetical protein